MIFVNEVNKKEENKLDTENETNEIKDTTSEIKEATKETVEKVKASAQAATAPDEAKQEAQEQEAATQSKEEVKPESKVEEPKASTPQTPELVEVEVSPKLGKIMKAIEELSVLELSDLVRALQTRFGVAAASFAQAPTTATSTEAAETVPEQTTFNVILANAGANKISVIKAVREIVPTLGLKEAKDLVDAAPKPVVEGVNKERATEAKAKLETAGAKVELQ